MLRRRTVLTAGLGLLGACDPHPAPVDAAADATPDPDDLVALALADRARTIHDAPPPSAAASTPLLFAADLGSVRTWDSFSLAVHADGRACLRRLRTAVTAILARDELARIDIPIAPTDTLKPVALALGTGHKFVLASIGRELAVQPGNAPPDGLGPVLREAEWLRGAFP